MNPSEAQTTQRSIEDLALKEVDMIYSLARVGEWTAREIGRRYGISENDVRKVVDDYPRLREEVLKRPSRDASPQPQEPDLAGKKSRKRRCDAVHATPAERQAAYRARLKGKRNADMQVPSPNLVTDSPAPVEEGLPVTAVDTP